MSTATLPAPSPVSRGVRLLTLADVAKLPRHLPSGDVRYELHSGRLVVMAPPGDNHSARQMRFSGFLFLHGQLAGHGEARVEGGIILSRYPDDLRAPDAAFLTNAQLPPLISPEGYLITIPELVVEVRGKNDTQPELEEKVNAYLAAGVVVVWVADPDARTVTAYRTGQQPLVFGATDTLTADGVIPGFAVPVADLLPAQTSS